MQQQLGFHHNMRRCTGCRSCLMACRNEHRLDPGVQWREVYPFREDPDAPGRHFLSVACNHCEAPECLRVCPAGAYQKRPDGIVMQDAYRCTGCKLCTMACPYGAPRYQPRQRKTSKCDFCTERLAEGRDPACVAACPTSALTMIDLGAADRPETVSTVPGFPSSDITTPSVRFTVPAPRRSLRGN